MLLLQTFSSQLHIISKISPQDSTSEDELRNSQTITSLKAKANNFQWFTMTMYDRRSKSSSSNGTTTATTTTSINNIS
jgi:hypothetical protein